MKTLAQSVKFFFIDYWIFGVIVSSQILDIMLFNNSNMMTKSSNFTSAVKVSFHEFQGFNQMQISSLCCTANLYCVYSTGNIRKVIKVIFSGLKLSFIRLMCNSLNTGEINLMVL